MRTTVTHHSATRTVEAKKDAADPKIQHSTMKHRQSASNVTSTGKLVTIQSLYMEFMEKQMNLKKKV
jgi:hypothetical protein